MSSTQTEIALLFDMDGVVVDNHQYHLKAWMQFCSGYGLKLSEEEFTTKMFGGNNKAILEKVFGMELHPAEISRMAKEKEELYREIHLPYIHPLRGLREFLESAKRMNIPTAIATAAPKENLEFVLRHTQLESFFDARLDESNVSHGKPDPEIYLKAAKQLGSEPPHCVVFEDSLTGIQAGLSAGMRVVGITTSLDRTFLKHTWRQINDFTEITVNSLFNEQNS